MGVDQGLPVLARSQSAPAVGVEQGLPGIEADDHPDGLEGLSDRSRPGDPGLDLFQGGVALVQVLGKGEEHDLLGRGPAEQGQQLVGHRGRIPGRVGLEAEGEVRGHDRSQRPVVQRTATSMSSLLTE
jgi:hypothetical protein